MKMKQIVKIHKYDEKKSYKKLKENFIYVPQGLAFLQPILSEKIGT